MNFDHIPLLIAEKLRDIATRQGNVPFDKGDLRKSHVVEPYQGGALLSANTPYARAVHEGRPAITIKPKRKKALMWRGAAHPVKEIKQPARKGNPWLERAVSELEQEGLDFLSADFGEQIAQDLTDALRKQGLTVKHSF